MKNTFHNIFHIYKLCMGQVLLRYWYKVSKHQTNCSRRKQRHHMYCNNKMLKEMAVMEDRARPTKYKDTPNEYLNKLRARLENWEGTSPMLGN